MKRSALAESFLCLATVLAPTGCGVNSADKYIGKWHVTDNHRGCWVDIEIVRNGERFWVIDFPGCGGKQLATLENGILKIGPYCSIVYEEASNRLVASACGSNTYEYERSH